MDPVGAAKIFVRSSKTIRCIFYPRSLRAESLPNSVLFERHGSGLSYSSTDVSLARSVSAQLLDQTERAKAAKVFAISKATQSEIQRWYKNENQTLWSPIRELLRKSLWLPLKKALLAEADIVPPFFLFVGTIQPRKQIPTWFGDLNYLWLVFKQNGCQNR